MHIWKGKPPLKNNSLLQNNGYDWCKNDKAKPFLKEKCALFQLSFIGFHDNYINIINLSTEQCKKVLFYSLGN